MHLNAVKSMVVGLGTKTIAHICVVGGFHLGVPSYIERDLGVSADSQPRVSGSNVCNHGH